MVFTKTYDDAIKQTKLSGSAVSDLLHRSPIKDRLDALALEQQDEEDGRPAGDGPRHISDIDLLGDELDDSESQQGNPSVVPDLKKLDDPEGKIASWVNYAKNLYARHVRLVTDPGTAQGLAELLNSSPIGNMKGTPGVSYVGVIFEAGKSGEPSARPHLRTPPLRDDHVNHLIKGCLLAADSPDSMPEGHLFFMMDGKTHGNEGKLVKAFASSEGKALSKSKKTLYFITSEDSERVSKEKVVGIGTINTIEFCHVLSLDSINLPKKDRLHGDGTNAGDIIGTFDRVPKNQNWHVKHASKATLYGGGPCAWWGAAWRTTRALSRAQGQNHRTWCHSHGTRCLRSITRNSSTRTA